MGNSMSAEEKKNNSNKEKKEEEKEALKDFAKKFSEGPNLRVKDIIMKFTSLDSSENLREHHEKVEAGSRYVDWIKNVAEKVADLTPYPAAINFGVTVATIIIDSINHSPPEESTKDALRSVFAEEKASEVWDQINECLKRYRMNIKNKRELVTDMRRIECQLSAALTKLKNSMLMDGHMSSDALTAWVNGAAFHIQMMIQLVRFGRRQTCKPVKELLSIYKNNLDLLFEKHQEMIKGKCKYKRETTIGSSSLEYLVNEESEKHIFSTCSHDYDAHFEAYYDHRYGRQKRDIQQYFSDVGQNLNKLIRQKGSLFSN